MNNCTRGVAVFMTVALAVALTAVPVLAFDARAGDNVTIAAGEEVNEDAYLAGNNVLCNGTVNGDIFAAGQTVTIGGTVANGVTAAGQTVLVSGPVGHGVRAAGSTVDIVGTVGRDVVAAGGNVTIHRSASMNRDLLIAAGAAVISGDVGRNVWGAADQLTIEGSVGGNVDVKVGTLIIAPGATVGGNLSYTAESEATIPVGAVKGTVTFTQRVDDGARRGAAGRFGALAPLAFFAGLTWKIIAYLMAFLTGLVLIVIAPRRMATASSAIRNDKGPVAGYGAIALFVTPIAAVVVCLTIIGLPLGIIALLLWGIVLYLSQLPVSLFIGHLILGRTRLLDSKGFMIGCLALGLLLIALVRAIPLVGGIVAVATALFGFGAFVVGERRRMHWRQTGDDFPMP
jgi:cytoskeletal protein CcmA (bactofilin family)